MDPEPRVGGGGGSAEDRKKKVTPANLRVKVVSDPPVAIVQLRMSLRCVCVPVRMPTLRTVMPNSSEGLGVLLKNSEGILLITTYSIES